MAVLKVIGIVVVVIIALLVVGVVCIGRILGANGDDEEDDRGYW